MTNQEQIAYLNKIVKTRIAPSDIQGVGVFALRDIEKGEKLYANLFPQLYSLSYANFGKLLKEVKQLLLERWPQVINGSKFAYPDTNIQAYMNHADDPNYDGQTDMALRDIKEGEEITEDYRKVPNYKKAYPFLD